MNRLKRAIRNWLGVNGDSSYPHRFVTLVTWHDKLIGVDGNGDLWELAPVDYTGDHLYVQLMQRNPLEGRYGRDE